MLAIQTTLGNKRGGFVNKQCLKKVDETNSPVKEVKQLPKKSVSLSTIKGHVQEKPVHLVTNVNHAKSSDMVLSTARKDNNSIDHVISSPFKCGNNQKTQCCVCCKYPSPIKLERLIPLLDIYPNKKSAEVLRAGFTDGFKLGFLGDRLFRNSPNLKSVRLDPDSALSKVMKEVKLNRIVGPFQKLPISNFTNRIIPNQNLVNLD